MCHSEERSDEESRKDYLFNLDLSLTLKMTSMMHKNSQSLRIHPAGQGKASFNKGAQEDKTTMDSSAEASEWREEYRKIPLGYAVSPFEKGE